MTVKSVYNFVPAPEEKDVFKPNWAKKVSQDIPFSDGESGEIELTIKAETPIFIRNGHSIKDAEIHEKYKKGELPNPTVEEQKAIERYLEFSNVVRNVQKQYFIPGSSLKGMIRNVLEIMTKSRMTQVADDRYGFRDLTTDSLYMRKYVTNSVKAGWLIENDKGEWFVKEVDFQKIKQSDINSKLKIYLSDNKLKSAASKYKRLPYQINTKISNDKGFTGILVVTGQAGSKKNEFVFSEKIKNEYPISPRLQQDFKFIYKDNTRDESEDWKFWKNKLRRGGNIPVFFNEKNGDIEHFGLSFMYKLPYKNSIKQLHPKYPDEIDQKDFAESLFGFTGKNDGSKGRVFIGHAFSDNAAPDERKAEILAGPKASYYPFYLNQPKKKKNDFYYTYMDHNAKLRGFKRYPIQKNNTKGDYDQKQLDNKKVFSEFIPLKSGAEFKCKIRFHNLRKVEIGSLISAITFHNTSTISYHNLGGAKPYGYGKVSISEVKFKHLKYAKDEYLSAFEKLMGGVGWIKADQIQELLAMAQKADSNLVYPKIKEFVNYKKDKKILDNYTNLVGLPEVDSLEARQKAIAETQRKKEEEEQIAREKIEMEKRLAEKKKIEEEKRLQNQKEREKKKEQLRNVGLSFLTEENDLNKHKKQIEDVFKAAGNVFENSNDINYLHGFIQRCIQKSPKRWKKPGKQDWKLVEKWVGKDVAKQWFEEFMKP